jgi:hypothetical protein
LIEDYSLRSLTKFTDRLPAISGLAQIFNASLAGKAQYLAGIWRSDIMTGLCWSRVHDRNNPDTAPHPIQIGYVAPSFSWASLNAPIEFKTRNGGDMPIGMTATSVFEAQILDAGVTIAGADPFGQTSGGRIKLITYTMRYKTLKQLGLRHQAMFDNPREAYTLVDDRHLLCMSLRSRVVNSKNPSHTNGESKDCLLIFPDTSNRGGGSEKETSRFKYRRVGFLNIEIPMTRKGLECPNCTLCETGFFEAMEKALAEISGLNVEAMVAAEKEEEERQKAAIGYGLWEEMELVIV